MKNSFRKGLFHPDDIKTFALNSVGPGPLSAPLPNLVKKPSRPSLSPIRLPGSGNQPPASMRSTHSRSSSFAAGTLSSNGGSFGRADARRVQSASGTEFDKYAEEDDEDYEDVFGKQNGNSACYVSYSSFVLVLK